MMHARSSSDPQIAATEMPAADSNIASWIPRMAALQPHTPAIWYPDGRDATGKRRYTHYTFAQLNAASDRIAAGLEAFGIVRGTRTVLMVKPSREFFALTFAIFKVGAVPVFVDPGIGLKNLGACLERAEPTAFIGIPQAHAARVVLGWARKTLTHHVTVGRRWFWGGTTLEALQTLGAARPDWQMAATRADEVAAILFTSGSTGVPKGAVYHHGTFMAQVDAIREMYDIRPGEIDLPTFPLFALFDPALGMTAVIPDMDFTRPAQVDPRKIQEAIEDFGVTTMFGSPALLNTVGRWGEKNGVTFPSVRRVLSAGAPMPAHVLQRFAAMLPADARIHPPYGATESLPVATMDHTQILGETWARTIQGQGVCIGQPVPSIDLRIIRITDDPIEAWDDALVLPVGEIGEITVAGPQVTQSYYNDAQNTARAKIRHDDGTVRHRMGDVGYLDADGRVWFCGRKGHRVVLSDRTLFTIPCEAIFNTHPKVARTALVGAAKKGSAVLEPVICVELESDAGPVDSSTLFAELRTLGKAYPLTAEIQTFLLHPAFPVDIRHNAKIGREKLAVWASEQLA